MSAVQHEEPSDRAATSRAVVLAGGGVAGIAWLLGIVEGLRREGLALADADTIVGTSAGACVAAQIATGTAERAIELQRESDTAEIEVPFDLDAYAATLIEIHERADTPAQALVRVANMPPLGPSIGEAQRQAVISARLPVQTWPQQRLLITAVDAETGELVIFDRDRGATLLDAVTASCALPGVWPAATIDGRRYVDGGARSPTNADVATGHDVVLVLVPIPLNDYLTERLNDELAALAPARTHVIAADADTVAAIGPNPLDPSRRAAGLQAGLEQAASELGAAARAWLS